MQRVMTCHGEAEKHGASERGGELERDRQEGEREMEGDEGTEQRKVQGLLVMKQTSIAAVPCLEHLKCSIT